MCYTLENKANGVVTLPDIGAAIGSEGDEVDTETFFGLHGVGR